MSTFSKFFTALQFDKNFLKIANILYHIFMHDFMYENSDYVRWIDFKFCIRAANKIPQDSVNESFF